MEANDVQLPSPVHYHGGAAHALHTHTRAQTGKPHGELMKRVATHVRTDSYV